MSTLSKYAAAPLHPPTRRYWHTLYDREHGWIDTRPSSLGPAVGLRMLLRLAVYSMDAIPNGAYLEIRADAPEGREPQSMPVLAIVWVAGRPHGATGTIYQTHVTKEGLGLL